MRIVTIKNASGHALHCIWHEPPPDAPKRDLACVLLSPGVKMRVAPHRLYRKLLDVFLPRGIGVLRVDFHGLGDSEGELPEEQLDQLYRQVQLGRHVQDARAGMDFLERELKLRKFIVGGLCGGALTGLLAAQGDDRVKGIYAIGIPVNLDGTGQHAAATMTRGQLESMKKSYLRKIFRPSAWIRFLTFQTDYRLLFSALAHKLLRRRRAASAPVSELPPAAAPLAENLNLAFARAFFDVVGGGVPALFLFSGADRLQWEYEEKFVQPWSDAIKAMSDRLTTFVIPGANHILSDDSWIAEAKRVTSGWLDSKLASVR